jgi:Pretoxin HINT domain
MIRASVPHGRAGPERARLARLFLILVALLGLVTCRPTRDVTKGLSEEATPLALRASAFEGHDDKGVTEWSVSVDVSEGRGTSLSTASSDAGAEVDLRWVVDFDLSDDKETFRESLLLRAADTVRLEGGDVRRVDALRPGDRVVMVKGHTGIVQRTAPRSTPTPALREGAPGALEARRVVATMVHVTDDIVTLTTERGTVRTTPEHPFYVRGAGWTPAAELVAGQTVDTAHGEGSRVLDVSRRRSEPTEVFNLSVEGSHTYFVGPEALLVHNMDGVCADPPAPPPPPGPGFDPSADPRFNDLANDPAIGGRQTDSTRHEATIGLTLEHQGRVPRPITREPTGQSEFVDATGQKWDVKAPVSGVNLPEPKPRPGKKPLPPRAPEDRPGAFKLENFEKTVAKEMSKGNNLMVDLTSLTPEDAERLRQWAAEKGFGDKILFFPE